MQKSLKNSCFFSRTLVTTFFTVAIGGTLLCAAPRLALATASQSGGLDLPKGASAWEELTPAFTGVLRALAAEKEVGAGTLGTQASVVAWKGADYKADRVKFMQTSITGALGKAGYKVRAIDSNLLHNVNLFDHFGDNSPFQPDIWKLPAYFVAINQAEGRGLVGAFLESKNALALGLLPIEVKAETKTPLPQVGSGALVIQDANDAMKGIAQPKAPAFAAIARKPKVASGQAKDFNGKPIAGATVHVESAAFGGIRTDHRARTDAQGRYSVLLPTGVCRVTSAYATIAYNGRNYALPLYPTDGKLEQFDSSKGHIENFVLKTYGATGPNTANDPGRNTLYYGGSLRLMWRSELADAGTFEVTLTPQGPLLGGSKGRPMVFRFPATNYEVALNDIPIGRYQLSAQLLNDGDSAPIRLEKHASNQPAQKLTVDFEPVSGTTPDFGYSGVRQFSVTLLP